MSELKSPNIWVCSDCAPKIELFTRRFLNQLARLLEEQGEPRSAKMIAHVASTLRVQVIEEDE